MKSIISLKLWHYKTGTSLADKILAVTKDLPAATRAAQAGDDELTNASKQKKVHEYEREIDALVYKLYDLTLEEIKIIENKRKV